MNGYKADVVHIYDKILLSHEKEWNNTRPRDDHPKWSKSYRKRQIPYDITCMWTLKYEKTMKSIYRAETDSPT